MNEEQFIKSLFTKQAETITPADVDLWPAIQERLKQIDATAAAEEAPNPDLSGGSPSFKARLSEVIQNLTYSYATRKESPMDNQQKGSGSGLSRRTFLKASGAAAAAVTIAGPDPRTLRNLQVIDEQKLSASATSEETIVATFCRPNCNNGCRIYAHVRDGKVVKTSPAPFPDPSYNRICLRGLTHPEQMYSDRRIKYPMKRAGERGEGKWERITWGEAIDTIASKFQEITEQYGSTAVAFTQGSGNFGVLSATMYGAQHRFFSVLGSTCLNNTLDVAVAHGNNKVFGPGQAANDIADLRNAKTIFINGSNVTESLIHVWHFIAEAQEAGAKVIVIDPIFTTTASKADQWVRIRPGTDAAFYLGMMQVVFAEGLENPQYIHDHTVGPFLVREDTKKFLRQSDVTGEEPETTVDPATGAEVTIDPYVVWSVEDKEAVVLAEGVEAALTGTFEVNGIKVTTALDLLKEAVAEYTPETVEEITTIPAQTLHDLAVLYATNTPSTLFSYMGIDHYDNGHLAGFAQASLASITGNIGIYGGTINERWYYADNLDVMNFVFPDYKFPRDIYTDDLFETAANGTIKGQPDPIKALYISTCNPVAAHSDYNFWMSTVLPSLDFIVAADIFMTDSVKQADIVLPVAHWFEFTDMELASNHPYIVYGAKAVEPLYESKSDLDILKLLANKMGVGQYFDYTEDELLQMSISPALAERTGCSLEKIKEDGVFKVWYQDPEKPNIGAGFNGVFGTPSGRAEFYNENPTPRVNSTTAQQFDPETDRLPHFDPPLEVWPEREIAKKYPLAFFQEHTRWRVHTQYSEAAWLRELDPEPTVKMSPADADARGISTGDYVEIYNDRGSCVVKAIVSAALPAGMVSLPKGWLPKQHKEGTPWSLTHMQLNPSSINQSYFDVAVEVRKWNGDK
ncbi:MAG TPA: molybdopterin-dependent oxidoreductase [Aggregatilinea sp.]|uniref:molybdopterin-containing oxidoreductase family protein n=1 Tax=Aggregatilinea sp. TaxID=2806333 RepID=UPI002C1C5B95|nr:molybdopterin-dependent oxidoreductase [Aggregatilinea sp.]HML23986.1 molybdopterin-dependent oxidoreductase [Aggregatilinea sp.]